ncbi:MAG: hypothetical protein ETSY1_36385 [Candidatus Entotheonella factor]|uniref:Ribbon-helix-helix protein CopG domain-containing protein n=1 Tax=Entotheonella factor TaxID=1429438 RepID=W4L8R5_ENTF1|nr:MAG: hypothetical protein ETSY1_36385 [Candidatus Entotheonella factor]
MDPKTETFSAPVDAAILAEMQRIAEDQERQLQSVIEEAFTDFIEKYRHHKARPHVLAHFQDSVDKNAELGRLLAL